MKNCLHGKNIRRALERLAHGILSILQLNIRLLKKLTLDTIYAIVVQSSLVSLNNVKNVDALWLQKQNLLARLVHLANGDAFPIPDIVRADRSKRAL